jgi:hypothetical protein
MKAIILSVLLFLGGYSSIRIQAQWIPVGGMDYGDCNQITSIGSTLFTSVSGPGLVRRNTNDSLWTEIQKIIIIDDLQKVGDVLIEHYFPYLYYQDLIYRSFDLGETWDTIDLSSIQPYDLKTIGFNLFMSVPGDILCSNNYGNSWFSVKHNLPTITVGHLFGNEQCIFYQERETGRLFKSTNWGLTWLAVTLAGLDNYSIQDIILFGNEIWVSVLTGIFRFNASLQQWQPTLSGSFFSQFGEVNGKLAGCNDGFFIWDQASGQWLPQNSGLESLNVRHFSTLDTMIYCTTQNGVFRTSSNSFQWEFYSTGIHGCGIIELDLINNEVWTFSNFGLFKSTDNGLTFQKIIIPEIEWIKKLILTDSLYFILTDSAVYVSDDYGLSWNDCTPGLISYGHFEDISTGDPYLYLVHNEWYHQNIYRCTYSPFAWEPISADSIPLVNALAAHEHSFLTSYLSSTGHPFPVHISHDNGETLEQVNVIPYGYFYQVQFDHNRFFIFSDPPIFFSEDDGYTWDTISVTQAVDVLYSLAENDECLVCGGLSKGFLKRLKSPSSKKSTFAMLKISQS